jgi:hypothetical protein
MSEHVIDASYLRQQATKCRYLARYNQPREASILHHLADEYDGRARDLSEANRSKTCHKGKGCACNR